MLCGFYALTAPRNLPALSRIPQPQIARPGKRPHLRGNFLDSPRKLQIRGFAGCVATDRILPVALRGLLIARCFHKSESNFICRMAPQVFGRLDWNRRREQSAALQSADKARKRKNCPEEIRGNFRFLRQPRLRSAATYVCVGSLVCKFAFLSAGFFITLAVCWP